MIDRAAMVEVLMREYPTLTEELAEPSWTGLTTLEISVFASYTQAQIDAGDRAEALRCFETARTFLLEGDGDVRNAVAVSYLEHLNFADGRRLRSWARAGLPMALAEVLARLE